MRKLLDDGHIISNGKGILLKKVDGALVFKEEGVWVFNPLYCEWLLKWDKWRIYEGED